MILLGALDSRCTDRPNDHAFDWAELTVAFVVIRHVLDPRAVAKNAEN